MRDLSSAKRESDRNGSVIYNLSIINNGNEYYMRRALIEVLD